MLSVSGTVTHSAVAQWWCNTRECRSLADDDYRWACDGNETWIVRFEPSTQHSLNGAGCSWELNSPSWRGSNKTVGMLSFYLQLSSHPITWLLRGLKQQAQIVVSFLREELWLSPIWYEQATCYTLEPYLRQGLSSSRLALSSSSHYCTDAA